MKKTVKACGARCQVCHKAIGKKNKSGVKVGKAVVEYIGGGSYYMHPGCHKAGYEMYHGRYVKKS